MTADPFPIGPRPGYAAEGLTPQSFRQVMGSVCSAVSILTTRDGADHAAMTASSLVSVSLDPLLVAVCIAEHARFLTPARRSGHWAASVLSVGQAEVARHFASASRPRDLRQFHEVPATPGPHTGAMLISGALVQLEARTVAEHRAGDHYIFVGEVVSLSTARSRPAPLTFFRGQLGHCPQAQLAAV